MEATGTTINQCARCIFRIGGKATCVAFPRGIPADIMMGRFDHVRAYEGDGGIRFVPLRRPRQLNHQSKSPQPR